MSLADQSVGDFLEHVAAREPAPGGGAVAAMTVAAAAGLVAMAARFSGDGFEDAVARAEALRARATAIAEDDIVAYAAVLAARRRPATDPDRRSRVTEALRQATDVPLAAVEAARDVALLGVRLARHGNPNLRGEAVTAVLLADGAGRSATQLVRANVAHGGLQGSWVERSEAACAALGDAARSVETSG